MNTDNAPLEDLDLCAVLDGEAGDAVLRRLADDPEARARLEQMRAVQDLVATAPLPHLSSESVDALVTAALGAADGDASDSDPDLGGSLDDRGASVVPVPLSRRTRTVPPWAVAAAVVVLVALGLSLVWMGRTADDSDVAFTQVGDSLGADTAADGRATDDGASMEDRLSEDQDASAAAGAAEMAPEAVPNAEDGAASTTAPALDPNAPTLVDLGEFPDADALREHLRDGFPPTADEVLPDTGIENDLNAAFRCLGKFEDLFPSAGEPTDVGIAIVDGQPTVVYDMPYVTDDGQETTLVVAVDEVSCTPILTFQRLTVG